MLLRLFKESEIEAVRNFNYTQSYLKYVLFDAQKLKVMNALCFFLGKVLISWNGNLIYNEISFAKELFSRQK